MAYNQRQPQAAQREAEPEGDVIKARDDYPDGDVCPECGVVLDENVNRVKHSIMHYGEYDLPNMQHANIVARQRQAYLLGQPIPRR